MTQRFVTVWEFDTTTEADLHLSALRGQGIPGVLRGSELEGLFTHRAGVELQVPVEAEEEALALLGEVLSPQAPPVENPLDDETEETAWTAAESATPEGLCPQCGSDRIAEFQQAEWVEFLTLAAGYLLLTPLWYTPDTRQRMICENCQADWLE